MKIFEKLLNKSLNWGKYKEELIFANITSDLNGEITTGAYEFFAGCPEGRERAIKKVVDASFEAIGNDECFSFFRYLKDKNIRYARVVPCKPIISNVCNISGSSLDDNINIWGGNINCYDNKGINLKSGNLLEQSSQKVPNKKISLGTILAYYEKYYKAINDSSTNDLYFYLVRPSLNNKRLNGMLYFASKVEIDHNALKEMAGLLSDELINVVVDKIRKESIKSAVSAIMSRNMSHNLGSHYLYYTKDHLEKISTEFLNYGDKLGQFAPDVRGASKVLGYVQGRMDYLATVISNDKYPYGAVNFKSHIFDELTIDDFSTRHFDTEKKQNLRTTNYLLTNLVLSENFTRADIIKQELPPDNYLLLLQAKLKTPNGGYSEFTGSVYNMEEEDEVKKELSQLQIALPGGTMSCHAFFNVIENFIRNSAKYLQSDFKTTEYGNIPFLKCTIAIRPNDKKKGFYDFIIYDNKENANRIVDPAIGLTLYESIVGRIKPETEDTNIIAKEDLGIMGRLKITDENGHIEKEAKGIKEMLFSSVWMNAYHFENNTYADIIAHINDYFNFENESISYKMYKQKLEFIEDYAFKFVQVIDKEGEELRVRTRNKLQSTQEKDITASLGIILTLPEFKQEDTFVVDEDEETTKQNLLSLFAEIVNVPEKYAFQNEDLEFSGCFTRPYYENKTITCEEKFKSILSRRFPDFTKYAIQLGDDQKEDLYGPSETTRNYIIRFKRHLNKDRITLFEKNKDYAYADSISGGNFTITMQQLLEGGWNGSKFNTETQFFALKVLESALTRITIIDERLFNTVSKGYGGELSLKNIRVLNYNTFEAKMSDVIVYAEEYITQGIKEDETIEDHQKKIKQRACEAITEAYVSAKRKSYNNLSYDEQNELEKTIDFVCNKICEYLNDEIYKTKKAIKEYKKETDDNIKKSYNKKIQNYVNTLNSDIRNAEALKDLVSSKCESIKTIILNAVNEFSLGDLSCILQGNNFRDDKENTLFLSIHLGLIEKMLKNSEWLNSEITGRLASRNAQERKAQRITDRLSDERVKEFMRILKEKFASCDIYNNKEIFISIHSGRGNYSKELEGPLKHYPFITLSALENAFNNSKYLLSQIFYNTVYIGKGFANEQIEAENE